MVQGKAWMCSHPPGLCGCLVHCGEGDFLAFWMSLKRGCVILPSLYPSLPLPRSARHKCVYTPFALCSSKGLIEGKAVGGGSDVRGITMMGTNSPESSFVTAKCGVM